VPATKAGDVSSVLTYTDILKTAKGNCMQCLFTGGEYTNNVHNVETKVSDVSLTTQ
jgi:hypothetical protein